jgi:hypothetical protein
MSIKLSKEEAVSKINLRKDTIKVVLSKNGIDHKKIKLRVCLVLDKTGSIEELYNDFTITNILQRILPVGLRFDDNEQIDVRIFDTGFKRLPSITMDNFYTYVEDEIMKYGWGGTNYEPVLNDLYQQYVIEEPSDIPTYVIFITDGETCNKDKCEIAVKRLSYKNIFIQFFGLKTSSNEKFEFLQKLNKMEGRFVDNANFQEIVDINVLTDEDLYNMMFLEYPEWEQAFNSKPKEEPPSFSSTSVVSGNAVSSSSNNSGFFRRLFGG